MSLISNAKCKGQSEMAERINDQELRNTRLMFYESDIKKIDKVMEVTKGYKMEKQSSVLRN